MVDPEHNFNIGDTVIALESHGHDITKGKRYIVIGTIPNYIYFVDDNGDRNTWSHTYFDLCEATNDFNKTLESILK